jgi:hypothetical protein
MSVECDCGDARVARHALSGWVRAVGPMKIGLGDAMTLVSQRSPLRAAVDHRLREPPGAFGALLPIHSQPSQPPTIHEAAYTQPRLSHRVRLSQRLALLLSLEP